MRRSLRLKATTALAACFLLGSSAAAQASVYGAHDVHGAIEAEYLRLGGPGGVLGYPVTDEVRTPDGVGAYNAFERGSIYWSPATGAHEVLGAIRDLWAASGWENGAQGFPSTDEVAVPGGVYQRFAGCTAYWTPAGGAHWVCGDIAAAWGGYGWEHGVYGFPVSGEYPTADGRGQDFERGALYWVSRTRRVVGTATPPVYANCTDVWNTLDRPIYTWDLGYRPALDNGGVPGVGCEVDPRP